jgi:hypothetical protein
VWIENVGIKQEEKAQDSAVPGVAPVQEILEIQQIIA